MRSISLLGVVVVFVGCTYSASCGGKTLNMEKAREFVSTTLEKDVGQKPTAVTCPESVPIAKGKTFECKALFGAPAATVVMIQDDDKGNVTIQSITGILISSKLEKAIADDFGRKLNVHVTAACGDRVRTATVGDTFTCDVKDAKGASGKVEVVVTDVAGKVNFKLIPSEAQPAPTEPPTGAPTETPTETPTKAPAPPE